MNKLKDFFILNIGIIVTTIGLYFFLVPTDLACGGVYGFAMVVNNIVPTIPVSGIMLLMNVVLFLLAFFLLGSQFGAQTIYSSFALSGFMFIFEKFFPLDAPIVDDLILNLVYGIIIQGIGMGILFYQNASTGGTDIIAKIINKYFHLDIGKSLLLADFLITLMAGITFGPVLGMYALLGIMLNAVVIDNVIEGLNKKYKLSIVSSRHLDIRKFIIDELDRSATVYKAEGAYSKEEKTVITTIMNKQEFIRLKLYVKSIDARAFMMVATVREVFGEGFIE